MTSDSPSGETPDQTPSAADADSSATDAGSFAVDADLADAAAAKFKHSVVLLPGSTLEDFPASASTTDARELLAAATVCWHPSLIAASGELPTIVRSDVPPPPTPPPAGPTVYWMASICEPKLPADFRQKVDDSGGKIISGANRAAMAAAAGLIDPPPLSHDGRQIAVDDFYAAAYTMLQIQIMTRRLRYSSNLDEIHVQNRLLTAAKSFCQGAAEAAIMALHDVFDALAAERDHYFTSDPHLIDLTLVSLSTLAAAEAQLGGVRVGDAKMNLLIDAPVCELIAGSGAKPSAGGEVHLGDSETSISTPPSKPAPRPGTILVDAIAAGDVDWAGGGPSGSQQLSMMSIDDAAGALADSFATATAAFGIAPAVYGRLHGETPADMIPAIAASGVLGMIPIDFVGGSGSGDESKVLLSHAGGDIEALTATPIDASDDASFLDLGAKLGTAIDSGEIATGLLAHWPGAGCDSMNDLVRGGSWGLALGKFWSLKNYFVDGERPYHHGHPANLCDPDMDWINSIAADVDNGLDAAAESFRQRTRRRHDRLARGILSLVHASINDDMSVAEAVAEASARSRSILTPPN